VPRTGRSRHFSSHEVLDYTLSTSLAAQTAAEINVRYLSTERTKQMRWMAPAHGI